MKWKKENKTKGEPGSVDGDTEISPQTSPQGWEIPEEWNFQRGLISLRVVNTLFPALPPPPTHTHTHTRIRIHTSAPTSPVRPHASPDTSPNIKPPNRPHARPCPNPPPPPHSYSNDAYFVVLIKLLVPKKERTTLRGINGIEMNVEEKWTWPTVWMEVKTWTGRWQRDERIRNEIARASENRREKEGEERQGRECEVRRGELSEKKEQRGIRTRWKKKERKRNEKEPDTRTSRMKIYRDARSSNNHVVECRRNRRERERDWIGSEENWITC